MTTMPTTDPPRSRHSKAARMVAAAAAAGMLAVGVGVLAESRDPVSSSAASAAVPDAAIRECAASLNVAAVLAGLPVPPAGGRIVPGGTSVAAVRSKARSLASTTPSLELRELLQNVADNAEAHELSRAGQDADRRRDTALALRSDAAALRRLCTGRPS